MPSRERVRAIKLGKIRYWMRRPGGKWHLTLYQTFTEDVSRCQRARYHLPERQIRTGLPPAQPEGFCSDCLRLGGLKIA